MKTPCDTCGREAARGVLTDIYITTGNLTWKESERTKKNVISVVGFGLERERRERNGRKGGFECGFADSFSH